MSKPRYLKLLAVVEEDYKPISGEITFENGSWRCENVVTIKLNNDFQPEDVKGMEALIPLLMVGALREAKRESDE